MDRRQPPRRDAAGRHAAGDGRDQGELDFAGRRWEWQSQVEATSDPALRRATLWVAQRNDRGPRGKLEERAAARLVGFIETRQ